MAEIIEPQTAVDALDSLAADAKKYFASTRGAVKDPHNLWYKADFFWDQLPADLQRESSQLAVRTIQLAGQIADLARRASLVSEADRHDIAVHAKTMRAALRLRRFFSWGAELLNDEDRVLGVRRAGQSDDDAADPPTAERVFAEAGTRLHSVLDLITASRELGSPTGDAVPPSQARGYRPGTAFIMMSMDPDKPELQDVADIVKDVVSEFEIDAVRADGIEHQGLITTRILSEIETAEFLFADLSGERPNVYYEIGYAHALKKRPILFRKGATQLHFDLAGYNCPSYKNLRDLRTKLTARVAALTNREPKGGG